MLVVALVVIALLDWQQRVDSRRLGDAAQEAALERTSAELSKRAISTAKHVAESAVDALSSGEPDAIGDKLQPFLDDPTVVALTVRNASGSRVFEWRRAAANSPGSMQQQATQPIRTMAESFPGAATPKSLGEVSVTLTQAVPEPSTALSERLVAESRADFRSGILLAGMIALLGGIAAAGLAWRAGRKLEQPIVALIKSAER